MSYEYPPDPIFPVCSIPQRVVAAMVAGGAQKEQLEGEGLCLLRVDSVDSEAWSVYEEWASSLGEADPIVSAMFAPARRVRDTLLCPPNAVALQIQDEANSIINHFAPLAMVDFGPGLATILARLAPVMGPAVLTNVRHVRTAVVALLHAIRDPGLTFPVIHGLQRGQYICQVEYIWHGATVVVQVFRG